MKDEIDVRGYRRYYLCNGCNRDISKCSAGQPCPYCGTDEYHKVVGRYIRTGPWHNRKWKLEILKKET